MGRRRGFDQSRLSFRPPQPYRRSSFNSMARAHFALLGLVLASTGCGSSRAPAELSGLWSASPAACEAGVGVRFRASAIEAVYDQQIETLFLRPRYEVEETGRQFRVRITYDLPRLAGGAYSAGAYGVMTLARQPGGGIAPTAHNLVDPRTGAVRMRMTGDPIASLLTLRPCGPSPWRDEDLRGRE